MIKSWDGNKVYSSIGKTMGRPWWYKDYWKKKGYDVSEPKDEFVEHFERQRKKKKSYRIHFKSSWVIISALLFLIVIFIILAYVLLYVIGI